MGATYRLLDDPETEVRNWCTDMFETGFALRLPHALQRSAQGPHHPFLRLAPAADEERPLLGKGGEKLLRMLSDVVLAACASRHINPANPLIPKILLQILV